MKKIFYILASAIVALGAVACENDGLDNIATVNGDTVSFIASIDNNRTALDGLDTVWDTDDTIQIEWNETTYNFKNSAEEPNKFSCTEEGLSGIVNANITATYSHNNDGNIDSNAGTAGALLTYTGPFAGIEFAVQNAFLKFTATADAEVILTASANIFSTGNTLSIEGTGKEQYVAVLPKTTTITYAINGEEVKTSQENALGKGIIYLLGELSAPVVKDGQYIIVAKRSSGNFFYMTPDLGTARTKRFQAVNTGVSELTSVTTNENYVWTVAKNGTTYTLAAPDGKYASWTSGNSAALADEAYELNIEQVEGQEYYKISSADETSRVLSLNIQSGSDYFAFYAGTQINDLYLIPYVVETKTLQSIAVSGMTTEYTVGNPFNFDGTVTATYTGDTTGNTYTAVIAEGYTVSQPDMTQAAENVTVTVTYEGKTATYTITVNEKSQGGESSLVEDTLTTTIIGTGSSYSNWSGKSVNTAVYAGNSMTATSPNSGAIQLRSKNASGIVTTTSGGKITKVTITNKSGTNTLQVYGKNTAYSSSGDLYNTTTQGELLGTIVCGTKTELAISGDYAYVGVRSANGAIYLTDITFTWATGEGGSETPDPDEPETPAEPVKLAIPTNLQADASDNTIEVRWTAVANASGYTVTCGTDSKDVTKTETSATFEGLDYSTKYEVSVVAVGDGTNYTDSDAARTTVTTGEDPNIGGGDEVVSETVVANPTQIANNSGYSSYSNADWIMTCGSNNGAFGCNSSNSDSKMKLGDNYVVAKPLNSSITSSTTRYAAIISKRPLSGIGKIVLAGTPKSGITVGITRSVDGVTWEKVQDFTSSSTTTFTFDAKTAYYAIVIKAANKEARWQSFTATFSGN